MDVLIAIGAGTLAAWAIAGLAVWVLALLSDLRYYRDQAAHWRKVAGEARNREWRCARIQAAAGEEVSCPRNTRRSDDADTVRDTEESGRGEGSG